ncbi:velvet factor-domain-containing protein [Dissophora ornata]|nr:hypothetical protein BGZ58_002236 [Dissophora ornata]KAI8600265.1 velvet factor-domain-containing protein [Dissophora ornata]
MVKSSSTTPYCFVSGQADRSKASTSSKYVLSIRQQPVRAKVCGAKERDRRPIDPPPIVQIKLSDPPSDRNKDYLQSPYLFMCCNLVHANDPSGEIVSPAHRALAGTVVSSLNRLKDVDNSDGGFFVFGDMSVRIEGHFRLRFTLFELVEGQVIHVMSSVSNPMTVHSSKTFPGMSESTFLSRSFSDQGVRIRIRKDHHVKPKRPLSSEIQEDPQTTMHSPPSSSHEVDHSDSEPHMAQSTKRPKSSSIASSSRHVSSSSRPKYPESRYSSAEPTERTPPSSPGSYMGQDPAPSRPRHHPYMPDDSSRRYSDRRSSSSRYKDPYYRSPLFPEEHYPELRSRRHDYPGYPRPGYDSHKPSQPKDISRRSAHGYPSSHSGHKERIRSHEHSRHYSSSSSSSSNYYPHHHYPSHERGHPYVEGYPSPYHGHSPSHPMGAAHSFPSPVHSSRPHYPHSKSHAHPSPLHAPPPYHQHPGDGSHRKFREPAPLPRHGFPAGLLNDQEMEYVPGPPGHDHHYHHMSRHSRTPSMSSQHSEGNFSPPRPFSPPESHVPLEASHGPAHGGPQSPTSPRMGGLTMSAMFAPVSSSSNSSSSRSPTAVGAGGSRIQLPPIHNLSTRSPSIPGPTFMETPVAPSVSYYVRP